MPANIQSQVNKYTAKSDNVNSFNTAAKNRNNKINMAKAELLGNRGGKIIKKGETINGQVKNAAQTVNRTGVFGVPAAIASSPKPSVKTPVKAPIANTTAPAKPATAGVDKGTPTTSEK